MDTLATLISDKPSTEETGREQVYIIDGCKIKLKFAPPTTPPGVLEQIGDAIFAQRMEENG